MAGNRMVGMTGFEPATSCSQSRRATKLRHIPTLHSGIDYSRRIEIRRKDFPSDRRCFSRRARPPLWHPHFPAARALPCSRVNARRESPSCWPLALRRALLFPAAPSLRASSPNEIGGPLTTSNPIHQGHHNHSHIRTTFFYVKYHLTGYTEYTVSNCT